MGFPGPGLGGIIARSSVPGPFALAQGQRGPKREHGATVFSKPGPSRGCPATVMQPVFAPFATGLPGRRREAEVPPGWNAGLRARRPAAETSRECQHRAGCTDAVVCPWGQRCGRRDADSSSVFERRPDPGAPARTTSVALSQPAAYRPGAGRRHLPHQARRRPPGRRPGTRRGGRGADCASGVIETTNRSNLQLRGVRRGEEERLVRRLLDAGLGPGMGPWPAPTTCAT